MSRSGTAQLFVWFRKTIKYRRTWAGAIRRRNWTQARIWLGFAPGMRFGRRSR